MNMKSSFLSLCASKGRKTRTRAIAVGCHKWILRPSGGVDERENATPGDVPKGHLVVYVGENYKRFVIKVKLLKHPLFKALLDHAREVYDFTADAKLRIPCDESIFLDVVRCAGSPEDCARALCV